MIACNLAGSRRVRAGSARDYILGFSAVNGFGDVWKAGGKVVKNVTGYDMCKLQAGAYGTLSALTELTLKVMPKPETACTIVLHGLADEIAIPVLAQALNSPFEVSGAAHLPSSAARRSKIGAVAAGLGAATALRLEGPRPSVAYRAEALEALVGRGARLDDAETEAFWSEVGAVQPLLKPGLAHRLAALSDAEPRCDGRACDSVGAAVGGILFRLGRRIDLAEPRSRRGGTRRWRSRRPFCGEISGRPRHAGRGAGGYSRRDAGVRTVERGARRTDRAGEERL